MRTSHRIVLEGCRKVFIDHLGMFGCRLERPVRGPKVNTSGVKANMETVEGSGKNVMSMGIGGVKLLGNECCEIKRED